MTLQLAESETGEYRDAEHQNEEKLERFTIYVKYRFAPGPDGVSYEEIDVDALNRKHASAIAKAALERDYEPGGTVHKIVHRPRGFMYL